MSEIKEYLEGSATTCACGVTGIWMPGNWFKSTPGVPCQAQNDLHLDTFCGTQHQEMRIGCKCGFSLKDYYVREPNGKFYCDNCKQQLTPEEVLAMISLYETKLDDLKTKCIRILQERSNGRESASSS